MSVFNVPSGRMEHVLHSSIVPKLYSDTWFWSVDLHHRYFVVRIRYLSINSFMNLVCQNASTSKVKCTQDRILPFTHFECGPSSSQTRQRKRTTLNGYKTPIPSEKLSPPTAKHHLSDTQLYLSVTRKLF